MLQSEWKVPPFPLRKTMSGRFVRLEPLNGEKHGDALFEICITGDAEQRFTYLQETMPRSRAEFQEWLNTMEGSTDPMCFVCILQETNEIAGRQIYSDIDPENGVIEFDGVFWSTKMARTPAATEAFYLFANHVMGELGYRRLFWNCNALNEASSRAALRFGFTHEGVLRQKMWQKGLSRDSAGFSIIDKEWEPIKNALVHWLDPENFDSKGNQKRKLAEIRSEMLNIQ